MLVAELTRVEAAVVLLRFVNRGAADEFVDRRTGCLMSIIPSDAFQLAQGRRFTGPRFAAMRQDAGMHVKLGPGEAVEARIDLAKFHEIRLAPLKVRYRGIHRNLESGAIDEIISNPVEVQL